MKCIKAIKPSKGVEVGDIKRVDDKTAYNMVGSMWAYIPKSEWKAQFTKQIIVLNDQAPHVYSFFHVPF